ncbi:MAG: hypothetical protein MUP82_10435, partial [Candidatus Marinimicrobia bacterium]|nr:hypothetical protein [Candidatus Neomarinimicrobiota bacterium]
IEVTVNSKDSSTEDGDIAASKACQKLAGVIRFILMHPLYLKLDFPAGFIAGTEITDITPGVPQPGDAFNTYALNLILNVRYSEDNGSISSVVGEQYTTIVKLDETDKGIKIEKIL